MLKNLKIENYALIEKLDIDFQSGLSVITGETGAGKSIILGALSLVLGQRSDAKMIISDSGKCVVEATFDVSAYDLQSLFDSFEVDYFSECIVRREILQNGKSRAFINDTPVNLLQLKELTSCLIDIHSQHESLLLSNVDFQLNIVDIVAKTDLELDSYKIIFENYQEQKRHLKELQINSEKYLAEKDYIGFQAAQLKEAQLIENEQESLEEELNMLNNSQKISENLSNVLQLVENEQFGVENQLRNAVNYIRKVENCLPKNENLAERLQSAMIEINDITAEIEKILNNTESNSDRKNFIDERLNLIYSLQQKHRVQSIAELLVIQQDFEQKLDLIENFDEEILKLQKEISEIENNLKNAAKNLSDKRKSVQKPVSEQIERMLSDLGMPNGKFDVSFTKFENFTPKGIDNVEFLFTANKNRILQPISQIASGGEISRLMLIIKSLVVSSKGLPTIIFDEIDTGISGEIAKKMGEILQNMGKKMQVVAITHLPQIASKGQNHYKVFKDENQKLPQTNIVQLSYNQRIAEIAEMIAGKNPSQSALNSAEELLKS